MMEFAAITISFGFYPDLKSIKYIKPSKKKGKGKKGAAVPKKATEGEEGDDDAETLEI